MKKKLLSRAWPVLICLQLGVQCVAFKGQAVNSPQNLSPEFISAEKQLRTASPDTLISLYLKVYQNAKLHRDYLTQTFAALRLSPNYMVQVKVDQAQIILEETASMLKQHLPARQDLMGLVQVQLSGLYMTRQDFTHALPLLEEGLRRLQPLPQYQSLIQRMEGIRRLAQAMESGNKNFKNLDFDKAASSYTMALALARQTQDPALTATFLTMLALINIYQDKMGDVVAHLQEASQLAHGSRCEKLLQLMADIGYTLFYEKEGDLDQAKKYALEASEHDELTFKQAHFDKTLFTQEIEKLDYAKQQIDTSMADKDAPDYLEDALYHHQRMHWSPIAGSIKIYLPAASEIPSWNENYRDNVKKAFSTWEEVLGHRIHFEFTDNPSEPVDGRIRWNNACYKLSGVTRIQTIPETRTLLRDDIDFNLKTIDNRIYDANTVYRLALHEVGHFLGINGHSKNPGDIMFPLMTTVEDLSQRDKATIVKLYEKPADFSNPPGQRLSTYQASFPQNHTVSPQD